MGVTAFSFTVPFTRIAVGALSPLFVGSGRAVVAAALAVAALVLTRQRLPRGTQWVRLCVVGAGIVIGFPLLTSFALVTAIAVVHGGGFGQLHWSDLMLLGAVLAAAVGYMEGGLLARELGAWQTVCWALVVCLPVMLALSAAAASATPPTGSFREWSAFGYLGVVSMFLGFFAWYRGLSIGPMAQVSQVQLIQPVLSIAWAGLLLGEHITAATVLGGLVVVACAGTAVRARIR